MILINHYFTLSTFLKQQASEILPFSFFALFSAPAGAAHMNHYLHLLFFGGKVLSNSI